MVTHIALLLAVVGLVAAGCTGRPVSLSAAAGSTIVFPLAAGSAATQFGFSSVELGYIDRQFGSTRFVLVGPTGDVTIEDPDDPGTYIDPVTVRWMTRAWPDPASPAGILNYYAASQVVAVLAVHEATPAGTYGWKIERVNPPNAQYPNFPNGNALPGTPLGDFVVLPPTLEPPAEPYPADPLGPTPFVGYHPTYPPGTTLDPYLVSLIPHHTVSFDFGYWWWGIQWLSPTAADFVLEYPADKIRIESIFERDNSGRRSLVQWRLSSPASLNQVEIHFVDPSPYPFNGTVKGITIAFSLLPEVSPLAEEDFDGFLFYADPGDEPNFRVVSQRFYDENGALLPQVPLGEEGLGLVFGGLW